MVDKTHLSASGNTISDKPVKEKPKKVYKEITECPENVFTIEKVVDWKKRIADYPLAI